MVIIFINECSKMIFITYIIYNHLPNTCIPYKPYNATTLCLKNMSIVLSLVKYPVGAVLNII